jgi:hypothetical protein
MIYLGTRCLRGPRGNTTLGKGSMDRSRRTSISRGVRLEHLSLPVSELRLVVRPGMAKRQHWVMELAAARECIHRKALHPFSDGCDVT